jgi:polysaccharide export outer membrane protein
MIRFYKYLFLSTFLLLTISFNSCVSLKQLNYFQDVSDTSKVYVQDVQPMYDAKIKPGDILGIDVLSIDMVAAAPFNLGNSESASPATQQLAQNVAGSSNATVPLPDVKNVSIKGYLVTEDGTINFLGLGTVKVEGLTTTEISLIIAKDLNDKYLKGAIVNTRILNYRITVLGEVKSPGIYVIPNSRVSITDMLGMVGDITTMGRRDDVLLIREENGKRRYYHLNLLNSKILESPHYYLHQNDLLYVKANRNRSISSDQQTGKLISYISLAIGFYTLMYSLIKR